MHLSTILHEMNIEHQMIGSDWFDSLGSLHSVSNTRLCSYVLKPVALHDISISIGLLIVRESYKEYFDGYNLCIVADPEKTFFALNDYLSQLESYRRFRFKTLVHRNADVSTLANIAKENVIIGEGTVIEEFVSVKENTTIGKNVVIKSGSVIGGTGLNYRHQGGVVIEDNVIIQYNCCIEKAVFPLEDTVISGNAKVDSFVHIRQGEKV